MMIPVASDPKRFPQQGVKQSGDSEIMGSLEARILPSSSVEDMMEIAMQFCLGRGVSQNLVAAHKWFNIAAMKGSVAARQYRCELAREMSASDVAEAQRAARAWLTLH